MTDLPTFERARRPEQKAMRREAIQVAARDLAIDRGVRNVTLCDIAGAVGTAKSNVLRYFGTREEIYLQLLIDDLEQWNRDFAAQVERDSVRGPGATAAAVAESTGDRPLLADLLSQMAGTLEHNVRPERGRDFKVAAIGAAHVFGTTLRVAMPSLTEEQAFEAAAMTSLLTGMIWSTCTTPPEILELLDPSLLKLVPATFVPRLERALHATYLGIPLI